MVTADWLIVGAGVGGLTLARSIGEHGKSLLVLEKNVANAAGAGLLLAPNATRVLQKLGCLDKALELGHATSRWLILDQGGMRLRELQMKNHGLPAVSICRADLLALLRSSLPPDTIQTGFEGVRVQAEQTSVSITSADGLTISGRALIGADGIRSMVREQIFGETSLRYRGYIGWRGIAPFVPRGYEEGVLSESWGKGGRFGIAPVDNRRTYWYASANHPETWIDETQERQAGLLTRFAHWHTPVADLIAATPNELIVVSRIYDGPKLKAWSRGNVTLLGDAAHAMTPNLGQGACLAMEDAWALGSILSKAPEPSAAFACYQKRQMPRALSIQTQSRMMGWVVQAAHPAAIRARNWITPRVPRAAVELAMKVVFDGPVKHHG